FRRSDASDDDTPTVDTDSDPDGFFAAVGRIGIESFQSALQILPGRQRLVRMITLVTIHSKEPHKSVAKEFVDYSAVSDFNDLNHCVQKAVQETHCLMRLQIRRARGKGPYIHKHYCHVL